MDPEEFKKIVSEGLRLQAMSAAVGKGTSSGAQQSPSPTPDPALSKQTALDSLKSRFGLDDRGASILYDKAKANHPPAAKQDDGDWLRKMQQDRGYVQQNDYSQYERQKFAAVNGTAPWPEPSAESNNKAALAARHQAAYFAAANKRINDQMNGVTAPVQQPLFAGHGWSAADNQFSGPPMQPLQPPQPAPQQASPAYAQLMALYGGR